MQKSFTVHAVQHREISPGKGSIVWLLSDEKGRPRKVNAITDINEQGVIDGVHAVYKRESPLVMRLCNAVKGDTLAIDFSAYNQEQNYAARDVYADMQAQEQTSNLSGNVIKVLLVLGGLALLWFGYAAWVDLSDLLGSGS